MEEVSLKGEIYIFKIKVIIGVIIAIVLITPWTFAGGEDDIKQIANEVEKLWDVANIHHIEVFEDSKSVVFFKTIDGTEKEMYLEKSLFNWECKRDFSFIPEGINTPIHLSFFASPYSKEDEYNVILLRVFDEEIDSVQIAQDEDIIHDFKILSKDSGERFGLFKTENDGIYTAEYIAYNSKGEVVYNNLSK